MKTTKAVIGRWPGVLIALGVDESYLTGKHGPCPICNSGKDKFRFDDKDGKGTYYCNSCGSGTGWKFLENLKGWDFKTAANQIDRVIGNVSETYAAKRKNPLPRLQKISKGLVDICKCKSVESYLFGRGLTHIPAAIYAHPSLPYYFEGKQIGDYPTMVARVVDSENKPLTLHCTYTENGKKIIGYSARKIMPPIRPMNCGSAVRLFPEAETMGIAEGIETAIAAFQIHNIPTWSVIHTNGIKGFVAPDICKKLIIFADNDTNFAGQAAAYELAKRLSSAIKVEIKLPEKPGTDWADCI